MVRETVLVDCTESVGDQVRALQNQETNSSKESVLRKGEKHSRERELAKWDHHSQQMASPTITQMSRHKITIRQKLSGNVNVRRENQGIMEGQRLHKAISFMPAKRSFATGGEGVAAVDLIIPLEDSRDSKEKKQSDDQITLNESNTQQSN